MAYRTRSVSIKLGSTPKQPSFKAPVIKGPSVPKLASAGVSRSISLPYLSTQARRGEAPQLRLAKAAAGGYRRSKRNPDFPTP